MGKGKAGSKEQREFMFVLNSKPASRQTVVKGDDKDQKISLRQFNLVSDEAKAARKKLIAELREFGC
ncbi:hypothetical protein H2509_15605 [Stappia sp. F7233]|uniref:Uncharacterized protein n=1 Tax=Stappia albiluteola TaxID=2758565 RepID=A0A839AHZ7_9HYPH|nr:hypothetical protein [Stappia albiluteola]MBA5778554.1 hypothetical protein [Stappia albiluteola]